MRGYRNRIKAKYGNHGRQTQNALGAMEKHVYQEDRALFNHLKVKNLWKTCIIPKYKPS